MFRYKIRKCGVALARTPLAEHRRLAHGITAHLLGTPRAPLCSVASVRTPTPFSATWRFIMRHLIAF